MGTKAKANPLMVQDRPWSLRSLQNTKGDLTLFLYSALWSVHYMFSSPPLCLGVTLCLFFYYTMNRGTLLDPYGPQNWPLTLSSRLTWLLIYWYSYWHAYWHTYWHTYWHSYWHSFWHTGCPKISDTLFIWSFLRL